MRRREQRPEGHVKRPRGDAPADLGRVAGQRRHGPRHRRAHGPVDDGGRAHARTASISTVTVPVRATPLPLFVTATLMWEAPAVCGYASSLLSVKASPVPAVRLPVPPLPLVCVNVPSVAVSVKLLLVVNTPMQP